MYLVNMDNWLLNGGTWYFNKKENAINKTIECFNSWIEEEYDGDIKKWEEDTDWNYEEEIAAIKTNPYYYSDVLEMQEIKTED